MHSRQYGELIKIGGRKLAIHLVHARKSGNGYNSHRRRSRKTVRKRHLCSWALIRAVPHSIYSQIAHQA
jgi:hypothetical protein